MNRTLNMWEELRNSRMSLTNSMFLLSGQGKPVRLTNYHKRKELKVFSLSDFTISIAGVQYTEFLLLFHCENLNSTHFSESVDIFSRTTTLDKSAETAINIFSNMTKLNIIDQTDMS